MADENQAAWDAVRRMTRDHSGPEVLAELIAIMREGMADGASDEDLALRLWPRLKAMIASVQSGESAAVAMGRRGGKRGGKARAKALSKERRSEIARQAATTRWKKDKPGA